MSLFKRRDLTTADQIVPGRALTSQQVPVTPDTALYHSGVWAALRVRADLISSMPVDLYRRAGGIAVEMPKSAFLMDPAGDGSGIAAWLYASQFDLDRFGNCYGLIRARTGEGFPAVVELAAAASVSVRGRGGAITGYQIAGESYKPSEVWHERQYVVAGMAMGLSPIAYAAYSIGGYLSAQKFASDWFATGASPKGTLRNTAKVLSKDEAQTMKDRFKAATANQDIFVTGSDWEYSMEAAASAQSSFLEEMQFGITDTARYLSVPADVIDGLAPSGNITYANIVQRNLQLLIINLQPAIARREHALSATTPKPRFVKLNTDSLLRMDPLTRVESEARQVEARLLAPSEVRAIEDRPPFTDDQLAEFDRLWPKKAAAPTPKEA